MTLTYKKCSGCGREFLAREEHRCQSCKRLVVGKTARPQGQAPKSNVDAQDKTPDWNR